MSKGYVYVLSNPSMPGLVKIGKTTRLAGMRAVELYQTGVPTPFRVEHERLSPDCSDLEKRVHYDFAKYRVSPQREFFSITVSDAIDSLNANLEGQIAEIVDEYMPDHAVSDKTYTILPDEVQYISAGCGVHPADVAAAFIFVTPEEFRPALNRWEEKKRRRE